MSDLLEKIEAFKTTKNYFNGLVSISYRTDKADYDINKSNFVLNGVKDGWFRKTEGLAKGHGLCINNIKITNRKHHYHNGEPTWSCDVVGDFNCYKAIIDYTNNDFVSKDETDKFWLFVHKNIDINSVIEYIQNNKDNWYP